MFCSEGGLLGPHVVTGLEMKDSIFDRYFSCFLFNLHGDLIVGELYWLIDNEALSCQVCQDGSVLLSVLIYMFSGSGCWHHSSTAWVEEKPVSSCKYLILLYNDKNLCRFEHTVYNAMVTLAISLVASFSTFHMCSELCWGFFADPLIVHLVSFNRSRCSSCLLIELNFFQLLFW